MSPGLGPAAPASARPTVVDPVELTLDIAGNASAFALPALLWALLYLVAWEHPAFAESVGLGRKAFWLLLPGGLLASLAILPFVPVGNDWVAVSFAGALFPIFVGLYALGRYAPPRGRSATAYLLFLGAMGAGLLLIVLPFSAAAVTAVGRAFGIGPANAATVLVLLGALVAMAALAVVTLRSSAPGAPILLYLGGLTAGVLVLTFAGTAAIVGVGITESFPYYLIPPLGVGFVAAALAPRVFPGREAFALPAAFLTGTFGVLLGADLLRQPPLYNGGPAALYTIGGAGVSDLVYLSGLMALAGAYLGHTLAGRGFDPVDPRVAEPTPTPIGRLGRAFREGVAGQLDLSLRDSSLATHEAAAQARRLLGATPAPDDRPWEGLPVPGWVVSDQANLDALARTGTSDPKEGFRAWLTARFLVVVGRDLGARRYAPLGPRVAAFAVDLALVTAVAAVPLTLLAVTSPDDLVGLLGSVSFNAAVYLLISLGFLYFVVGQAYYGTTVGKRLFRLAVRDRSLGRPGGLAALVRTAPNLPILTILVLGLAIGVAFSTKAGVSGGAVLGGFVLPGGVLSAIGVAGFVIGGIALLGAIGALTIALSPERQRVGDVWAGTWVIQAAPPPRPAPRPPGPGRSA